MIDPNPELFQYKPFPAGVLPEPVKSFVRQGGKAIGCDPSYIALPLISALGMAIGNTHRIFLKPGWCEYPIFWTTTIGPSGTLKSPAFKAALRPLKRLQSTAFDRHEQQLQLYCNRQLKYEKSLTKWKQANSTDEDPPEEPKRPVETRYFVSDVTVEALAPLLRDQPRGLLMENEELTAWIGGFDAYKRTRGSDVAHWLQLWQAGSITVDRKSAAQPTIHVPLASVGVTGCIQLEVLSNAVGDEHFQNGLVPRMLMSMPPKRIKKWSEDHIDSVVEAEVEELIGKLLELPFGNNHGEPTPVDVRLTSKGRECWAKFYTVHANEQATLVGREEAAWSKLEAYCARFALLFHMIRMVTDDDTLEDPKAVDAQSVAAGLALVKWFGNETQRIYAAMRESGEHRMLRELVELIRARGGRLTVRELSRSKNRYRDAQQARQDLEALVAMGMGTLTPVGPDGGKGGRRSEVFELVDVYLDDKTLAERHLTGRQRGFVSIVNGNA